MPTPTTRERKKKAKLTSEDLIKIWPWGVSEYLFHLDRKWRFDWCDPESNVAIEMDGYQYHTIRSRWLQDMEKMNSATALGWQVFHFTPDQIRSGDADHFMQDWYEAEHNKRCLFEVRNESA